MQWYNALDRFDLKYETPVHYDINAITAIEPNILINDWQWYLPTMADLGAMFHLTFPATRDRMRTVKEIGHEPRPFRRSFP